MDRAQKFCQAATQENQGREKTGWRYSPELRSLGVAHCRARREEGYPFTEIAAELGISTLTLSRWQAEETPPGFRPVEVVADAPVSEPPCLSVITPRGLRIEGLSWPQVVELARAL